MLGQAGELLTRPLRAVAQFQALGQTSPQRQQITHVIEGITNLLLRQWPTAPFRECLPLHQLHSQKLPDQRPMAERIS